MAWTIPKTWSVGEVLTAGSMNAQVRDDLSFLYNNIGIWLIQAVTLAVDTTTIDLTGWSAPVAVSNLMVVLSARSDQVGGSVPGLQLNADTGTNYDWENLYASGTSVVASTAASATSLQLAPVLARSSGFNNTNCVVHIPDYATAKPKVTGGTFALYDNGPICGSCGGRWASTAAISRLTFVAASGNYLAGSKATLYGLV